MPNQEISQYSSKRKVVVTNLLMLSANDWGILTAALFLLPVTAFMLRFCGVRRTGNVLLPEIKRDNTSRLLDQITEAKRISRLVHIAAHRGLCNVTCLERSFVLFFLLRRRGSSCELIFGSRLDNQSFSAHAWVELEGVVINDHANVRQEFSAFDIHSRRKH